MTFWTPKNLIRGQKGQRYM